ncbi:MAG: NAD(P)-dependent oxidoreductase [Lachnospiraceae bacterium]|nr:NAD(P)-dependent oxidoreductase [Lachnospiraceae bacterium]
MEKYVITGASGFIGKNLIKQLAEDEEKYIYAVVRGKDSDVSEFSSLKNVNIVYCELDKIPKLEADFAGENIKTFIHLAWEGSTGAKRADCDIQMRDAIAAVKAYETAEKLGCDKFMCAGTISERVLDQLEDLDNVSQNMVYALAKQTTYNLLNVKSKTFKTKLVWMQFSNVFGPGNVSGNLISYTVKEINEGRIPEFGSGMQPYNFIFIYDLIDAICALDRGDLTKQKYFLGSGEVRKLKDYLLAIPNALGKDVELGIGKRPDDGIYYKEEWFDISDLKNDTGFEAKVLFEEGIRRNFA